MANTINIIILVALAVIDLWLVFTKRKTISHRWQKLFPTFVDLIIMGIILVVLLDKRVLAYFDPRLIILDGVTIGHILWPNKERFHG